MSLEHKGRTSVKLLSLAVNGIDAENVIEYNIRGSRLRHSVFKREWMHALEGKCDAPGFLEMRG